MSPFLGEVVGAALLVVLGNGVVANVLLTRSKDPVLGPILRGVAGAWLYTAVWAA